MGAGVEASDWLKPRLTTYNYTRTFLNYSVLDQTFWWKDRPDNDRDGGGGGRCSHLLVQSPPYIKY